MCMSVCMLAFCMCKSHVYFAETGCCQQELLRAMAGKDWGWEKVKKICT